MDWWYGSDMNQNLSALNLVFVNSTQLIYEVPTMCQALSHQALSPINIYGTDEGIAKGLMSG